MAIASKVTLNGPSPNSSVELPKSRVSLFSQRACSSGVRKSQPVIWGFSTTVGAVLAVGRGVRLRTGAVVVAGVAMVFVI